MYLDTISSEFWQIFDVFLWMEGLLYLSIQVNITRKCPITTEYRHSDRRSYHSSCMSNRSMWCTRPRTEDLCLSPSANISPVKCNGSDCILLSWISTILHLLRGGVVSVCWRRINHRYRLPTYNWYCLENARFRPTDPAPKSVVL
jgi:hypothetical protein